ncbi:GntR family transcriptional regulator [Victivallaceae bacterium BBE-744-WT-12]|uniref:GntR family transcriptional regulator n=1 Tax=Victivallis lenta TaxID=2606640 RepID=A0A844FYY4_9BACT|nr:GntR family transcriptional regulator [Victivallis lenta]AVM46082.1 GntR family transcriptional regulator [Victivallales bacterium CCUG 44730]MST96487.1 GntR family transcriptional regulator [Victivallis lenta]HBP06832.1 GntR family transcriptional regulator [Lentisphaeria bacterium]HCH86673.1 GntR family transcriptional regulator [Lentisphaeria bacterium]
MKIDPDSGTPIYLQIIDELKTAVLSGRYRDGDRVLPVRELAVQLRVNPNTVAKAYRLMQDEGLLVSRPGGGTFIAVPEAFSLRREREEAIAAQLGRLVAKAKAFDIGPERLRELLDDAWKRPAGDQHGMER